MQTWPIFIGFIELQSTRSADRADREKFIKYKKMGKEEQE